MEILVIVLIIAVIALAIFMVLKDRQIKYYKTVMANMSAMVVMQRMFEIMASNIPASNKIQELNNIIIDVFATKYSTISIFDGTEYEVKATNVEDMYVSSIASLAEEADFKNNAVQNVSKYLVTEGARILGYKSAMERKIKSAMFSPIYYNGTYLGFWILEDTAEGAYDSMSKEQLAKLKDNIGVFIESILDQQTIENAHDTDRQTGLYNNIYLYSNARPKTSSYETSSVIMIAVRNLPVINEEYSRGIGDRLLQRVVDTLKEIMSSENMIVRYTGSRICIICPGVGADNMHSTMERFLSNCKGISEMYGDKEVNVEIQILVHNIKKQSNIEKELNKMSSYLDEMTDVNTIKII